MQHKIRINDLARELEVKSKSILDVLVKVGVTEKKTHSSSIEVDEAERVKKSTLPSMSPVQAVAPVRLQQRPTSSSPRSISRTSPSLEMC